MIASFELGLSENRKNINFTEKKKQKNTSYLPSPPEHIYFTRHDESHKYHMKVSFCSRWPLYFSFTKVRLSVFMFGVKLWCFSFMLIIV